MIGLKINVEKESVMFKKNIPTKERKIDAMDLTAEII